MEREGERGRERERGEREIEREKVSRKRKTRKTCKGTVAWTVNKPKQNANIVNRVKFFQRWGWSARGGVR